MKRRMPTSSAGRSCADLRRPIRAGSTGNFWYRIWIFLGALLASGLSVYLVQRYWAHEKRREHTEVAGFIFAGVAVLYAVLLAFVVILGWETLNSAHATTYTEADQLSNIYWIARSLPTSEGPAIEDLALKYAHTVIDREWPLMNEGKTSPEARDLLTQIRADVFRFSPRTRQQQVLYEQAVVSVNGLTAARRDRLDAMTEEVPEPICCHNDFVLPPLRAKEQGCAYRDGAGDRGFDHDLSYPHQGYAVSFCW